jgi:hypothetical protein
LIIDNFRTEFGRCAIFKFSNLKQREAQKRIETFSTFTFERSFVGCGGLFEFVIPRLAKATNERCFQEFIGWQPQRATIFFGTSANLPSMKIHRREMLVFGQSHGIKMARNGLHKRASSLAIGLFDGTFANAIGVDVGKNALAPTDERCYQIALHIAISHTLLVDYGTRLGREIVPHGWQSTLQLGTLARLERCTTVALDAALTTAHAKIAAKHALEEFETHHRVANLDHRFPKIFRFGKSSTKLVFFHRLTKPFFCSNFAE